LQLTAVARPFITSNPFFNGRVLNKSCPRNHCYLRPLAFGQGVFVFANFTGKFDD